MQFKCSTTGRDPLGLAKMVEQFASEQWIADHYTPEQAVAFIMDRFKRTIATSLEQMELCVATNRGD